MESKNKVLAQVWLCGAWAQFLFLTGVATYLSLVPDPGESFQSFSDKSLHALCWFVLLCSLYFATRKKTLPWYLALALLAYSGVIEVLQGLMPPRQMSLADLLANGAGIVAALLLIRLVAPLYQRWFLMPLRRICGMNEEDSD